MKRRVLWLTLGLARLLERLVARTLPRGRCAPPPPVRRPQSETAAFLGDHLYVLGRLEHIERQYAAHTLPPRIPRHNGSVLVPAFLPLSYAEYERLAYAILTEGYGVTEDVS